MPLTPADPASVAVPLPLSTNVTPPGRAPALVSAGAGDPVVVTLKVPALPAVKVVVVAEVMAGAWVTTKEKLWVAVPAEFLAVIVSGGLGCSGSWNAGQCARAVAVVHQADAARWRPGEGERRSRGA